MLAVDVVNNVKYYQVLCKVSKIENRYTYRTLIAYELYCMCCSYVYAVLSFLSVLFFELFP